MFPVPSLNFPVTVTQSRAPDRIRMSLGGGLLIGEARRAPPCRPRI